MADQDDWRVWSPAAFNATCTRCPRLAAHLEQMRIDYSDYHNAPVPPFGDPDARLLIVGLAPGAHGANATGRPFTGDYAGLLLYRSLFKLGFATRPESRALGDGLELRNCRITNAVKCLPPAKKATNGEVDTCHTYLACDIASLPPFVLNLSPGSIAHRVVFLAYGAKLNLYPFGHGRVHELSAGCTLVDSYHCSRYNTQTGRLTAVMFEAALARAK